MATKKKNKPDFSKPKPIVSKSKKSAVDYDEAIAEQKAIQAAIDKELEEKKLKFDTSKKYINLPLIVIAGRPNVGKSTLFNRFMHKRVAITDPTPGVTRDPVDGECFIFGKPVHLMDTGGYKLTRDIGTMEAVMDDLVVEKTLEKIKNGKVFAIISGMEKTEKSIRHPIFIDLVE